MERLREVLLAEQADTLARVLAYARSRGYAQRLPMLEESYRAAVEAFTATILQAIGRGGSLEGPHASDDPSRDPVTALGMRLARARLADGQAPELFIGLLGYFRRAYHETLAEAALTNAEQRRYDDSIDRFFDKVEVGYAAELTAASADSRNEAVSRRNLELMRERNRYVESFAALPVPVMFLDADSRVENINDAAASLFLPPGRRGSRQRDAGQRQHPPVLRDEIEAFVAGDEAETGFESELKTSRGSRFYQVRFNKLHDVEGGHSGTLVVLTDLTHRKHAEDALRRSQAKYASLFENMLTAFAYMEVVLDERNHPVDLTFRECNEAFARMVSEAPADLVGRRLTEVFPGIGAGSFDWIARLTRVGITGEPASFDALIGHIGRWFSATAYSAAPGFVSLMLSDISELKWIQESLGASRDYYLTLFDGLPSLIWRADVTGYHDYFNRSWLEFTGRSLDEQRGEGWIQSVHPDDRQERRAVLARALERREPFTVEYRLAHRDGGYRWVLDAGRPFQDLEGQYAGFIGSAQDISDRRGGPGGAEDAGNG